MSTEDVFLAAPATAHVPVISSLAGALRAYVETKFPKGWFRDVNITTEDPQPGAGLGAGRWSRRRWGRLHLSNVDRPEYPIMTVRVDPTTEQSQWSNGQAWFRQNKFAAHPGDMRAVLQDDESFRWIGVQDERMQCRFLLTFTVESFLKAQELARHVKNVFPCGMSTYINDVPIAAEIPAEILRHIWADMGLDAQNQDDRERFDRYIRSNTAGFAERTVKGSSGRMAFGFRYRTNVLVAMEEPSVNSERSGNVTQSASVELAVTMDLPFPTTFGYRQEATLSGADVSEYGEMSVLQESGKVYLETAILARPSANLDEFLRLMFLVGLVSTDDMTAKQDATELQDQIPESLRDYILHLQTKPDYADLFKVILWRDGVPMGPADYAFDVDTWTLTINQSGLRYNYKYHVGIYCDMGDYARLDYRPKGPLKVPSPYDAD